MCVCVCVFVCVCVCVYARVCGWFVWSVCVTLWRGCYGGRRHVCQRRLPIMVSLLLRGVHARGLINAWLSVHARRSFVDVYVCVCVCVCVCGWRNESFVTATRQSHQKFHTYPKPPQPHPTQLCICLCLSVPWSKRPARPAQAHTATVRGGLG